MVRNNQMISKIDFPDKVEVTLSVASGVEAVLKKELIRLKKENQQLRMENDILKQAALILGRR